MFCGFKHHLCSWKDLFGVWCMCSRSYASKVDWKELRPMILKRIKNRAKDYPAKSLIPVANDVLKHRTLLHLGVSKLLNAFPIKSCKFCPEVYIGEEGHKIRTCHGFKRVTKDREHQWEDGHLDDILVPVEVFHLENMFQDIIRHDQRFSYDRIPAVIELCLQAGADFSGESIFPHKHTRVGEDYNCDVQVSNEDLQSLAQTTLDAWENVRLGVRKLLLAYPAKVCKHCSEVHIGPSGHRARLCGVFKYESWRAYHFWKKAEVNDLVPPKMVWHRRPHDPEVLLDGGRGFYGHAPAVVELCARANALIPTKYFCMMKVNGLATSNELNTSEARRIVSYGVKYVPD